MITGLSFDTAEQSLMKKDVLCFGLVAERIGRAVAGEMRKKGNVITHVILPIVGVAMLVVLAVAESPVTWPGRSEVLRRPLVYFR